LMPSVNSTVSMVSLAVAKRYVAIRQKARLDPKALTLI
jgi:hypothetical protein